jgi:hypothetical protein
MKQLVQTTPSFQLQVELLKVKVSQQFVWCCGCAVPSLSQVQVELKVKVSQQFTLVLQVAVPSLSHK